MALIDNLISYWKLDEESGNASDSVGSNTGTNTNVTYSAGKINNGAVFNGSAKLVMGNVLNIAGAITVSAWVYYAGTGTYTVVARGSGDNTQYILDLENKAARFYVRNTGLTYYLASKTAVPENQWVFITGTWAGGANPVKVYVNASAGTDSSNFSGTQATGTTFDIGANVSSNYMVNGGKIDEVGVWSRALSSTEVTELYNSGNGIQYPFTSSSAFFNFF
jgi:hypothetical protein